MLGRCAFVTNCYTFLVYNQIRVGNIDLVAIVLQTGGYMTDLKQALEIIDNLVAQLDNQPIDIEAFKADLIQIHMIINITIIDSEG